MSPICFSRFDALAEEPRGAVLDNMFMGGICNIKRPLNTQLYHRVPHNFETFNIKVVLLFPTLNCTDLQVSLVADLATSQGECHLPGHGSAGQI